MTFSEKTWYEDWWDYFKWLSGQIDTFAAVAISSWAVSEVLMAASDHRVPIEDLALPVLVLATVVALYRAYRKKSGYVPASLVGESATSKGIFRKQKCGWNAALARQMLEERLQAADAALRRIEKGSEFIGPRQMDYNDYVVWLQMRPEMVLRMVRSAALLCTQEVPIAICSTKGEDDLVGLKREIVALSAIYECAKEAEVEWHEVVPPDEFREVHEMVYGWTQPIRNGVHRFLDILDELANVDRKTLKLGTASLPSFEIVFEKPDNLNEFSRRLDQISP